MECSVGQRPPGLHTYPESSESSAASSSSSPTRWHDRTSPEEPLTHRQPHTVRTWVWDSKQILYRAPKVQKNKTLFTALCPWQCWTLRHHFIDEVYYYIKEVNRNVFMWSGLMCRYTTTMTLHLNKSVQTSRPWVIQTCLMTSQFHINLDDSSFTHISFILLQWSSSDSLL